jgi:hypothetical protein
MTQVRDRNDRFNDNNAETGLNSSFDFDKYGSPMLRYQGGSDVKF